MARTTLLVLSALLAFVGVHPKEAWAHGGRLNSSGCHNNRKTGGYHCHRSSRRSSSSKRSARRRPRSKTKRVRAPVEPQVVERLIKMPCKLTAKSAQGVLVPGKVSRWSLTGTKKAIKRLSSNEMTAQMCARLKTMLSCKHPKPDGSVLKMKFYIFPSGKSLVDPELTGAQAECMYDVIETWTWPTSSKPTEVTISMSFEAFNAPKAPSPTTKPSKKPLQESVPAPKSSAKTTPPTKSRRPDPFETPQTQAKKKTYTWENLSWSSYKGVGFVATLGAMKIEGSRYLHSERLGQTASKQAKWWYASGTYDLVESVPFDIQGLKGQRFELLSLGPAKVARTRLFLWVSDMDGRATFIMSSVFGQDREEHLHASQDFIRQHIQRLR